MFGWLRRLRKRREPERLDPTVEILVNGQWQACRVVGKSGLLLSIVVHDPMSHRYSSVMVQPEACRDIEHAKRLLVAMTESAGERLVWENGSPYNAEV